MEGFDPAVWDKVGAVAVFALFSLLIAFGRLLPRSWVQKLLDEKDKENAYLRQANDELRAVGGTVEDVLVSIRELAQRRRERDDGNSD